MDIAILDQGSNRLQHVFGHGDDLVWSKFDAIWRIVDNLAYC
uniref:Uncharacterized protein n=1 Tax=Romanomermis culicivorax TaxID=13658 RepID=A0A915JLJ2_ROMCU